MARRFRSRTDSRRGKRKRCFAWFCRSTRDAERAGGGQVGGRRRRKQGGWGSKAGCREKGRRCGQSGQEFAGGGGRQGKGRRGTESRGGGVGNRQLFPCRHKVSKCEASGACPGEGGSQARGGADPACC